MGNYAAVGSRVSALKRNPGGYNAVRDKPPQIFVWNRVALRLVNVYEDLEDYMRLRKAMDMSSNGFIGLSLEAKTFSTFLKKSPVGKDSFFESSRTVVPRSESRCAVLGRA